jgi:hypothetical protein
MLIDFAARSRSTPKSERLMTYRLHLRQANQWSLVDDREEEVVRGPLSACEAWLDARENGKPAAERNSFATFRLSDWIHRIWAASPADQIKQHSS